MIYTPPPHSVAVIIKVWAYFLIGYDCQNFGFARRVVFARREVNEKRSACRWFWQLLSRKLHVCGIDAKMKVVEDCQAKTLVLSVVF